MNDYAIALLRVAVRLISELLRPDFEGSTVRELVLELHRIVTAED